MRLRPSSIVLSLSLLTGAAALTGCSGAPPSQQGTELQNSNGKSDDANLQVQLDLGPNGQHLWFKPGCDGCKVIAKISINVPEGLKAALLKEANGHELNKDLINLDLLTNYVPDTDNGTGVAGGDTPYGHVSASVTAGMDGTPTVLYTTTTTDWNGKLFESTSQEDFPPDVSLRLSGKPKDAVFSIGIDDLVPDQDHFQLFASGSW